MTEQEFMKHLLFLQILLHRKNFMKNCLLLVLLLTLITAPDCPGAAILESSITTIIPSAAIVNTIPSFGNNSLINPQNGSHSGLEAVFNIKTNGDDNIYDFVLSGLITTTGGEQNGYFLHNGDLYLLLANKNILPDISDVYDISSGTLNNNKNLIAYPILKNPDLNTYYKEYNNTLCCKVESGGRQDFNITQRISGNPLPGSYSLSDDSAGTYEAIITLNIYRKP